MTSLRGQRRAQPRQSAHDRGEDGYIAILVAMLCAAVMLPLCAISVDVARWYVEIERVQNAADAAALAGVTFLPDDFASATATAVSVAGRNGYPNSGNTTVTTAVGAKPTQLVVTVTSRIPNAFAASFNKAWTTVSRSATADYNGPAPMGSPCNAFGNEPPGAVSSSVDDRGPSSSVIVPPPGGATCSSNPQFWGAVAGPNTPKGNGDAHMTRACGPSTDGCTGTTNDDFDPRGYFYVVRVGAAAKNTPVTLQIYDPAWVETGDTCTVGPTVSKTPNDIPFRDNMGSYTPNDGIERYKPTAPSSTPNNFCDGDVLNGGTTPITTSYALRQPTDTHQPSEGVPILSCQRQYGGLLQSTATPNSVSSGTLAQQTAKSSDPTKPSNTNNPSYNVELAKVFHQWVRLCTFTPTESGDYYLQVRTNVKLGGISDGEGGFTNNPAVFDQSDDDTTVGGSGNNRFSLRVKGPQAGAVSIAGWQSMSIYANYSGASSIFNLVRVIPAAATKILNIKFFDVGDATAPGSISVLAPLDSNITGPLSGCTGTGVFNGPLTNCQLNDVKTATYNGKYQVVSVPVPSDYTCNATQPGGCWFRLKAAFPSALADTTTWSASIDGDPVRMIK